MKLCVDPLCKILVTHKRHEPGGEIVRVAPVCVECGKKACEGCAQLAEVVKLETTAYATPPTPVPKAEPVLLVADKLIHGERAATHGPVDETFHRIATIFDAMLSEAERSRIGVETPPTAVAKMLIALKLARESYNPGHRDNLIDAAGYIGLLDELKVA